MQCSKCHQPFDFLTREGLCENCNTQAEARRCKLVELARQQCQQDGVVEIDDDASPFFNRRYPG